MSHSLLRRILYDRHCHARLCEKIISHDQSILFIEIIVWNWFGQSRRFRFSRNAKLSVGAELKKYFILSVHVLVLEKNWQTKSRRLRICPTVQRRRLLVESKSQTAAPQSRKPSVILLQLLVSTEEANARWTDKLCRLRSKFFGDAADHAPWMHSRDIARISSVHAQLRRKTAAGESQTGVPVQAAA